MTGTQLGGPIALIVIGLILALAVADRVPGVDLVMIGYILAAAGAVWLVLVMILSRGATDRRPPRY